MASPSTNQNGEAATQLPTPQPTDDGLNVRIQPGCKLCAADYHRSMKATRIQRSEALRTCKSQYDRVISIGGRIE